MVNFCLFLMAWIKRYLSLLIGRIIVSGIFTAVTGLEFEGLGNGYEDGYRSSSHRNGVLTFYNHTITAAWP